MIPGQLAPQQTAAINLPASLFAIINDRPNVGVFFALYNTSVLFPVNGGSNRDQPVRTEVVTDVLAATVGPGIVFQNLEENVTVVLRVQVPTEVVRNLSMVVSVWFKINSLNNYSSHDLVQSSVCLGISLLKIGQPTAALP